MPTCPRCVVAALALLFVLTGCSSNSEDNTDFSGSYAIAQITFTSPGVQTANVSTRINAAASDMRVTSSAATVTFEFGANATECEATDGTSGVAILNATAGRGTLTLSARSGDDRDVLRCLLLPERFTLRTAETETTPQTLTATIENTRADLNAYDSDNYGSGLDNVEGTLNIRFTRK